MNAILPEGFVCIADETNVILARGHIAVRSLDLADAPEWRPETWVEDLCAVLWQVLSDFQDELIEQLREAWPPAPGGPGIAVPDVSVEEGAVRGWYCTEAEVVVSLDPIDSRPPGAVANGAASPPSKDGKPS